ncbi:MAG: O-antigen ligase family protein [Verrucomicrobiota bacterium]
MNRNVLDNWCEQGILGLVLAILVFGPLATGAVRPPDFLIIQGLTGGVLLLWMARLWLLPKPRLLWPPVCWAVLAFTGYAIGRYCTADIEYVARQELIRVLVYAGLFLAIVNNLHRQETVQTLVLTLIFLALAVAGYAIFQFFTGADSVWTFQALYGHRGTGTFISPNNCAGFLEMILPLALAWVLVSRAKPTLKVFIGYAALVIVSGIAVTVSRGGWLSTTISLMTFFSLLLLNRNHRLPALVVLAALILGGVMFLPRSHYFKARVNEISKNNKLDSNSRFDLWLAAVHMWRENPWWGVGPAHYDYRFRAWRPVTEQKQPDRAHNDYLNTLADWGIVGVVLVGSAWALLGLGTVKTWRYVGGSSADLGGRSSNKFALVLGASMGLVAILVHSALDFNLHIPANAILAVTLMAFLTGSMRFASEGYWFTARLPLKLLGTVFLAALIGYLGWQGVRRTQEVSWRRLADRKTEASPLRTQLLEKSFAVEPMNAATAFAIGESLRLQSWEGNEDYPDLARAAIQWFDRAAKLNPYDGYNFLRTGMCLDWIGEHEKAGPFFNRADELDPNGYFTSAWVGWHYVQLKDYAAAKVWFDRSMHLNWDNNQIADTYLKICDRKLAELAAVPKP